MRSNRVSPVVIAAALSACAYEPESLNSERIEVRFGSYGIEVISHVAGVRRSSLFSVEDGTNVCRTFAVARFEGEPTSSVAGSHADVLAGQSIGATFKSTGWQIRKITLHIGKLSLETTSHPIGKLMHLETQTDLAVHAYRLLLEKGKQSIDYATIVEAHHPDYLSFTELTSLYGDSNTTPLDDDQIHDLTTLVLDSG